MESRAKTLAQQNYILLGPLIRKKKALQGMGPIPALKTVLSFMENQYRSDYVFTTSDFGSRSVNSRSLFTCIVASLRLCTPVPCARCPLSQGPNRQCYLGAVRDAKSTQEICRILKIMIEILEGKRRG